MNKHTYTIRPLRNSDIETIVNHVQQNIPNAWPRAVWVDCLKPNYYGWVLQKDIGVESELIGAMMLLIQSHDAELLYIVITPTQQKKGYGQQLLQQSIETAKSKGCKRILLEVRESNQQAITFYQQAKFQITGRRKNYYVNKHHREDAILMTMEL